MRRHPDASDLFLSQPRCIGCRGTSHLLRMVADLAFAKETIMKKMFLAVAVAGLFTISGVASASDRGLSTAWPGVSSSMARLVKSTTLKSIAASIVTIVPGLSDRRVERPLFSLDGILSGEDGKPAEGNACPWCPDPPCS